MVPKSKTVGTWHIWSLHNFEDFEGTNLWMCQERIEMFVAPCHHHGKLEPKQRCHHANKKYKVTCDMTSAATDT